MLGQSGYLLEVVAFGRSREINLLEQMQLEMLSKELQFRFLQMVIQQ